MEAKISVAMPPTSSSGHVSKFYNKSRKQAIQLWEVDPKGISRLGSLRVPVKSYVQVRRSVEELED